LALITFHRRQLAVFLEMRAQVDADLEADEEQQGPER
jgi:hypothetical protein